MRSITRSRKLWTGSVLTAVLAAGAGVAVGADGTPPEPLSVSEQVRVASLDSQRPTTAVAAVPKELETNFQLFRERPATPMPAEIAAQIGSPKRYGRNPALARKIKTVTGDGWVVPGDGWICIAIPDPVESYGTSCQTSDDAVQRGVAIGLSGGDGIPAGKSAQVALLPDDVAAVRAPEVQKFGGGIPGAISTFVDSGEMLIPAGK